MGRLDKVCTPFLQEQGRAGGRQGAAKKLPVRLKLTTALSSLRFLGQSIFHQSIHRNGQDSPTLIVHP
ncbi:MAG TPA: hypothetical protein PKC70_06525 [Cellvibrionaceae bacterium]|nr:hypothetical protein [Cellvibrionaceae bacterium]HNG59849.1 hypothetical protein [Cellvibrionaceae bacterium]